MSRRTLHRRLNAEETALQRVLDKVREDVAWLLGAAETNACYRALRAWIGICACSASWPRMVLPYAAVNVCVFNA